MKQEDTVIVGAGPIGLACAISAKRRGVDPLVIDAGAIVNSIVHYPVGMTFFTSPELLEIGGHPGNTSTVFIENGRFDGEKIFGHLVPQESHRSG